MSNQLALSTPSELTQYLQKAQSSIAMALPKHLNPDRMVRLAVTCWSTTPALRKCTPQSILGAIVVASQLGLEPGIAGQAYLIPYGNTCQLVPGWQGLTQLLNNTGKATVWTGAVFEGDEFDFQLGSSPRLIHRPGENSGEVEKLTHVYACGQVNGSQMPVIECWPIARVWKHRDKFNKVGDRHYSYNHPEMYARKVVLLQVLKYMPRSIEVNNAVVAANAVEGGRTVKVEDGMIIDLPEEVPAAAPVARRSSVAEAAAKTVKPQPAVEAPADIQKPADGPSVANTAPSGAPTVEELQKKIRGKLLGKADARDFVSVLIKREMLKDACVLNDVPHQVLLAADEDLETLIVEAGELAEGRK